MFSRQSSSNTSKLPARARRSQWALHRAMAEPLEPRRLLSAELVKDINLVPTSWDSEPTPPVAVGDIVFFTHRDTDQRRELWKTDGTEAGTVMLRDFQPGWPFTSISDLTASNGLLFFVADDSVHGKELWKSDGTASGTVMVRDIFPGIQSGQVKNLADVNGTLFFSAWNGVDGTELWKSDGTEAGTVMVRNINPGSQSSSPRDLANIGGTLFFVADNGVAGFELWKSDGTSSGTMMVRDIWSGNTNGLMNGFDPEFTDVNGTLFFVANNGLNGRELWRSNGTSSGTVMVRDIRPDVYGYDDAPRSLTNVNGTLFFTANDTVNGPELWKSDGTTAGTVMVRDIRTRSLGSLPRSLVNINGTLFFSADHLSTANELWKSDGTAAGTVLVRDIRGGGSSTPMWLTDLNGTLFFAADNGVHGYELWKSDGTAAGTVMVRDIQAGSLSGIENFGLNHFLAVNQTLFFRANDSVVGKELWKTDGTTAGTMVVRDIWPGTSSSSPREIVDVNGTAFFRADDGIRGSELWKSDGTAAGTVLVKDIYVATGTTNSSSPRGLTNANGTLFFFAHTVSTGVELWKSEGTAAGTVLVRDVRPGQSSAYDTSAGHWIEAVGGTVFFTANDGISGSTLWKSDGTAAGTVPVRDVALGNFPLSPKDLVNVNGTLFFSAHDSVNGRELWKSDGTAAGTVLVRDINPGAAGSAPRALLKVDSTLFFVANDGVNGEELWKSDGTAAGTVLVREIRPGQVSPFDINAGGWMEAVNGALFFSATDGVRSTLWKSDGSFAGTVPVREGALGSAPWGARNLVDVNGTLFFTASDSIHGHELWKSDGTAGGTLMVRDILPGVSSGFDFYQPLFTNVAGTLYFVASDLVNGFELWRSDGTEAGTVMVQNIHVGSARPQSLANVNGTLFFVATDHRGEELWKVPADTIAPTVTLASHDPGTARVAFSFGEAVQTGVLASALVLQNLSTGETIPGSAIDASVIGNAVSFTFPGYPLGLPNGQYRATLLAGSVKDLAGNALASDHDLNFSFFRGDMNSDGSINNLDIAPFVQGLTSPSAFATTFGYAPDLLGDVNQDGAFNNLDIAPFVALLTGGRSIAPTPPPSSVPSRAPVRPVVLPLSDSSSGPRVASGLFGDMPMRIV